MPAAYVILRFDKNFQLSALVSAVSDTYVFGTVPAYEENVDTCSVQKPTASRNSQES